jgi:hypothetical protein
VKAPTEPEDAQQSEHANLEMSFRGEWVFEAEIEE